MTTTDQPAEGTETAETPDNGAESAADATEAPQSTPGPEQAAEPHEAAEGDERGNPNAEAAKYRKQLRATEAERDSEREHVEHLQRAVIELMAGPRMQNVDDFARFVDLSTLVADDGKLDRTKIGEAIDALLKERPYLATQERRRPWERPKLRQGTPVGESGPRRKPTLAEQFGGRDDVTWGGVLNKQGEHAPSSGSRRSKVESELHIE
jgi:hypothetical protein